MVKLLDDRVQASQKEILQMASCLDSYERASAELHLSVNKQERDKFYTLCGTLLSELHLARLIKQVSDQLKALDKFEKGLKFFTAACDPRLHKRMEESVDMFRSCVQILEIEDTEAAALQASCIGHTENDGEQK